MFAKTNKRNLKLKVMYDTSAESPIERSYDEGIVGNFICWHSRYSLGHSHNFESPTDLFEKLANEYASEEFESIKEEMEEDKISYDKYEEKLKELVYDINDIYILPLFLYDHSGITINTIGFSCPWDSGQVGYVYTTKDTLNEIGVRYNSHIDVENRLKEEVKVYDEYLRGNVYGFCIVEYDEETEEELDEVDSCWGFYGDDMYENGMIENMCITDKEKEEILIHGTDAYKYLVNY